MSAAERFRAAVESWDLEGMVALLAPEVRLHSPAKFRPLEGREAVRQLFIALSQVFEDFHYVHQLRGDRPQSPESVHGLVFRARVGDKQIEGLDLLEVGEEGLITDLTVMIRPISGLLAVAEGVNARLSSATPAGGAGQ